LKTLVSSRKAERGIALMIVMMVIFVLSAIVAGFIYSMKIEMRLARNDNREAQLEWMARGAVEIAKFAVTHKRPNMQGVDALNEEWSGAPIQDGDPLSALGFDLKNIDFGPVGSASVTITDLERKWNVNVLANPQSPGPQPEVIRNILEVMGVADRNETGNMADCIIDWINPGERPTTPNGVKNDYYLSLDPPYYCKNGYMDDVSEFMRIKGILPEMVSATNPPSGYLMRRNPFSRDIEPVVFDYHFDEVFTTMGAKINANTAPAHILMMVPGIDSDMAQNIVQARAGDDGVVGTEDDAPFRNPSDVMTRGISGGLNPGRVPAPGPRGGGAQNALPGLMAQRFLDVYSQYFEVKVEAHSGDTTRVFYAVIYRPRGRDAQTVKFYPE
jgi:general secretion pathway protein K